MITFKQLQGSQSIADISIEVQHNLEELLSKINQLERIVAALPVGHPLHGFTFVVTSGLRTMQEHVNIYFKMGITDRYKIPMKSKHLCGMAVDISDPDGKLYAFVHDENQQAIVTIGLWCEVKDTHKRVHFQTRPPGSGNRFFNP